jgi:hypothetical protein
MHDLSLKGGALRYGLHRPFTGDISIIYQYFSTLHPGDTVSLRSRFEYLARTRHRWSIVDCDGAYGGYAEFDQIWSHIEVRIGLHYTGDKYLMAPLRTALMRWAAGIPDVWSNRWGCGGEGRLPCRLTFGVQFRLVHPWGQPWPDAHHVVRVDLGQGSPTQHHWYTGNSKYDAAHEFGHMLGLKDEYPDDKCPNRSPITNTLMGTIDPASPDFPANLIPARLVRHLAAHLGCRVVPF